MFNSIFIISRDYTSFKQWPADAAKIICPSVLIEQTHAQQIIDAYSFFSKNPVHGFSISISADTSISEPVILDILSFLFIPSYYAIGNRRVINLIGTANGLLADAKKNILAAAHLQDIEDLTINCLLKNEPAISSEKKDNKNYFFTDTESLLKQYHAAINAESIQSSSLFLLEPHADLEKLNAAILQADQAMKNKNPLAYNAITALNDQAVEIELLQKKITAAENELNNYKSHVEILRSSHQAKELQDYYDKEYEVLPLWYKRFGHLVKVIAGKRSFRSLFNKNIKKSKD